MNELRTCFLISSIRLLFDVLCQDTIPLALRVVANEIPALLDLGFGKEQRARMIASRSVLRKVVALRWITWHQMDGVTGTVRCAQNHNMTVGRVGRTTRKVVLGHNQTPVCIHVCACMHVCIYLCVCMFVCVRACVRLSACISVCCACLT